MPEPTPGENRGQFLARCMADPKALSDFPGEQQRYAFCNSVFERAQAKRGATSKGALSDGQPLQESFSPPQGVRDAAQQGLDYRSEFGRGGTPVGIARARDLSNGTSVSPETILRMVDFFNRHQKNRVSPEPGEAPTNGWIAWLLWGGDAGQAWANKVMRSEKLREADKATTSAGASLPEIAEQAGTDRVGALLAYLGAMGLSAEERGRLVAGLQEGG